MPFLRRFERGSHAAIKSKKLAVNTEFFTFADYE